MIDFGVEAVLFQKLRVRALFHDSAVVDDQDDVGVDVQDGVNADL